ncbi:hypothetical protein BDV98DRAFT_277707 [Pterulicium gracile]|uniref:Uncharacterized protein n=1 Tax=Pterulicium gracile TaxID=1884261 RepID=A0A5C3QSN2_9AGAR|nr:hypothetical protein BDV98DRAFT_277707 [Pterula gracilis]
MAYTPDRSMITSNDGTKICAEALGDKTNVAVVFVHEFCCDFKEQFKPDGELAQSLFILHSLRRTWLHGRSGSPLEADAYKSLRHAEDLQPVLDAFGVERPFVAGWYLLDFLPANFAAAYTPSSLRGVDDPPLHLPRPARRFPHARYQASHGRHSWPAVDERSASVEDGGDGARENGVVRRDFREDVGGGERDYGWTPLCNGTA